MYPEVDMLEMKATWTMTEASTPALGTTFPKRGKKNKKVLNIYHLLLNSPSISSFKISEQGFWTVED